MNLDMNTLLTSQSISKSGFDSAAKTMANAKKEADIAEAAKDFEAMFVTEMMKPMFEGLEVDEQFGGGKGEEVFRGMMLEEYGKMMAESGQIGIADSIKAQLLSMQEVARTGSIILGDTKTQKSTTEESVSYDTSI